jgi:hypothetical protein
MLIELSGSFLVYWLMIVLLKRKAGIASCVTVTVLLSLRKGIQRSLTL